MTSPYYTYSFISLFCFGMLLQNYFNMRKYGPQGTSGTYFRLFILSLCLCSLLDTVYGVREAGLLAMSEGLAYAEEILYTSSTVFAAYCWFFASESMQRTKAVATKAARILFTLPLVIMVGITLFTPLHKLCFYFENGHYIRGPLTLVFTVFMGSLIVVTGAAALARSFMKRFYMDRIFFRVIFLYAVALLVFQALQTWLGASVMPFRTMGAALVIYIIQQRYIKANINTDPLTGANNRNAADHYLNRHFENRQNRLQVALLDLDSFKKINDTYGHEAGDRALRLLCEAFKRNLGEGVFFARYGGDEFLLIDTYANTDRLERVIAAARQTLKDLCARENMGFTVTFSCGLIQKTPETETIPDVIKAADEAMYEEKRSKKAGR